MRKLNSILLIDDDPVSNLVTKMMLTYVDAAHELTVVLNGKEALDYLQKNRRSLPELILLDINMPVMSGFDFLDQWERRGLTGSSKICMFTTSTLFEDKDRARYYSDVIAYVEKPLSESRAQKLLQLQYEATFGG